MRMAAVLKVWCRVRNSEFQLRESMCICVKKNLAKFHPDPIWNDGASGFFEERRPNKKNNNKISGDILLLIGEQTLGKLIRTITLIMGRYI